MAKCCVNLCALVVCLVPAMGQAQQAIVQNAQLLLIDNVELASATGGVVVEINFKHGDPIRKDQTLVRLDYEKTQAELEIAKSEMQIANKERENRNDLEFAAKAIEVAQKQVERSEQAVASYAKVISQAVIDRQRLEHEQAVISKRQAEHTLAINQMTADLRREQLRLAEINLDERKIVSPIDGQVVEIVPQIGEWVAPGATVARIINVKTLRVEALVPASMMGKLKIGQTAIFSSEIGEQTFEAPAELTFVSPEIDAVNQDFKIWAEIDNSSGSLSPGMVGSLILGN